MIFTSMRRATAAVVGVAMSALILSGCLYSAIPENGNGGGAAPIPTKAPVTTGVADELVEFYGQELVWEACGKRDSMDCTTVRAPMDYENPADGDIELAVIRLRASEEAQGSLLTNPGGPGGSGYDWIRDYANTVISADVRKEFDVIGFDPRGVGSSTAVTCFDGADMDSFLYDIPKNKRGTDEWQAELDARSADFADACAENSGEVLEHITTINSARDMDLLRGVLGDEKLNYVGFSYGTFLGATYAGLFPERTGRLVLDGAIDPAIPSADVGKVQAFGFEGALRAYMQSCLDGKDCPYSGTVDQALTDLGELLVELDAKPLENSDGRKLGADSAFTGIVVTMYSQESWPYLTQALSEAEAGNGEIMMFLADAYNGRDAKGKYADNSSEAFIAYNCMDYPDDMSDEQADEVEAYINEKAPTIAPYWSGGDTCANWPYPPSGSRGAIVAEGAAPIVVLGTTNDPATPYEWSVSLAEQLESGVLLTRVGEGHTGYGQGNKCIDGAIDEFLLTGTPPENNTTCQ